MACWRKERVLHLRMSETAAGIDVPSVGIKRSFGEVWWIAWYTRSEMGMDCIVLFINTPLLDIEFAIVC
jgi:hypothetical protein